MPERAPEGAAGTPVTAAAPSPEVHDPAVAPDARSGVSEPRVEGDGSARQAPAQEDARPGESHAERARRRMRERTEERRRKKRAERGKAAPDERAPLDEPGGERTAPDGAIVPGDAPADGEERNNKDRGTAERPRDPKTKGWKTFAAGNGAQFLHPPRWTVQETPGGLLLSAPGADPMKELVLGTASPANGITDPASKRAQAALDQLVRQSMPMLRRQGEPRVLETGVGKGAVYDYAGKSPLGQDVKARVFAVIVDGTVGGFTLMAEPSLFERRAADVERMFVSLAREELDESPPKKGDIDPRIAGKRFQGENVHRSNGIGVTTQLVWAFNPDGTLLYGAKSAMSASKRDYEGNLEWTASGLTDGSVERGRYTAMNGILDIRWKDGRRWRNAYGFEPDGSLVLRDPATKKLINFYAPVR